MFDYRGAALRAQRVAQTRNAGAITFTQPAPIGGWNTRDDAGNMPPQDAELLVNWIPEANFLRMRRGSVHYATVSGTTKPVGTIAEFKSESLSRALYCTQDKIAHVVSGAVVSLASGFSNGEWSHVNFNNQMGLFNGVDSPQTYDGTSLTQLSISGPNNPNSIIDAHVHRGRVFYVEKDICGFWYGDADTLGGSLTFFPLSRVARQGGSLLTIKSWTVDGGEGPDDYAVFIMNTGEVVVYQGNDPGRSATWGLVGRYTIAKPVARRGCVQMGSQIVVITEQDYVVLPSAFNQPAPPATKLSGAIRDAVAAGASLLGWQAIFYPAGPWLLFNIPTSVATTDQYVVNLKGGASTKFSGWNARAFGVVDGLLYFGGCTLVSNADVFLADSGLYDQIAHGTAPTSITTLAWQAPSNLGQSLPKTIVDYRPRLQSEGDLTIESGLAYDFGPSDFNQSATFSSEGATWNTSDWNTADWSTENFNKQEWLTGGGDGTYVQLRMTATAPRQTLKWFKTDYRYRMTGPLE